MEVSNGLSIDLNGDAKEAKDKKVNKKAEKKKLRKKQKKQQKAQQGEESENQQEIKQDPEQIQLEYVFSNPLDEISASDPLYSEFEDVFKRFMENQEEEPSVVPEPMEEMEPQNPEDESQQEHQGQEEEEEKQLSNKEKKKKKRTQVAVLKQLVERPDVVESWDVTASDPAFLVYLKSYRNTIPVPKHWSQKRKYLQGKRGIEKPPFALPEFIANTGIGKLRGASASHEDKQSLKQKQRDRMHPKIGKIEIDYEVLYEAFFKHQTKPKMTVYGDLYYEGKEFEVQLREKKPGILSDELKRALGMPEGVPPPWLFNMQRYGPPPSYPKLKIPGLNCPIPEGARWGYQPGGWGKPPVDEYGQPLYGDIFGVSNGASERAEISQPIQRAHWGELQAAPEEEEAPPQEQPVESEERAPEEEKEETVDEVPAEAVSYQAMEAPSSIQLRKTAVQDEDEDTSSKPLYQVLQPSAASVGGSSLHGSSYTYEMPVSLNPSEVGTLEGGESQAQQGLLKKKLDQAQKSKEEEDQSKKRKKESKSDSKKFEKSFKF